MLKWIYEKYNKYYRRIDKWRFNRSFYKRNNLPRDI
jgi:hypothetical protein